MKKVFMGIFIILTFTLHSQDFAPIGAIWHYSQGTINPDLSTFKTFESVSDTTINGFVCRKLVESERYIEIVKQTNHFMFSRNDSVFFFAENEFQLLYDFGATKGDTIVLSYFKTNDGSSLKMIIDSVGSIEINGQKRKLQFITCGDGMYIEFGLHVIEGIGNTFYLFPTYDNTFNGPLRCFQSSELGLFLSPFYPNNGWNGQDCEEIITSINNINIDLQVFAYPNPFTSKILIYGITEPTDYWIYNLSGKLVANGTIFYDSDIVLHDLNIDMYFLMLSNKSRTFTEKIIKK